MAEIVIVDTNILFSALVSSESAFGKTLLEPGYRFFVGERALVELFKNKERIVKASRL